MCNNIFDRKATDPYQMLIPKIQNKLYFAHQKKVLKDSVSWTFQNIVFPSILDRTIFRETLLIALHQGPRERRNKSCVRREEGRILNHPGPLSSPNADGNATEQPLSAEGTLCLRFSPPFLSLRLSLVPSLSRVGWMDVQMLNKTSCVWTD